MLAQNKAHTRNQDDNRLFEGGRTYGYFGNDGVFYGGRNCKYFFKKIYNKYVRQFVSLFAMSFHIHSTYFTHNMCMNFKVYTLTMAT